MQSCAVDLHNFNMPMKMHRYLVFIKNKLKTSVLRVDRIYGYIQNKTKIINCFIKIIRGLSRECLQSGRATLDQWRRYHL